MYLWMIELSGIGLLSGLVGCVMWGRSRHVRNRDGGSSAATSSFGINRLMDSSSSLNTTTISIVEEIGSNKSGEEEAGGNGTSKGHISVKDMNGERYWYRKVHVKSIVPTSLAI